MDISAISELISTHGFSAILMGYFLLKDWKFNEQMLNVMGEVKEVLAELRTWHAKEDSK